MIFKPGQTRLNRPPKKPTDPRHRASQIHPAATTLGCTTSLGGSANPLAGSGPKKLANNPCTSLR